MPGVALPVFAVRSAQMMGIPGPWGTMAPVKESATTRAIRRRYEVPDVLGLRADEREVLAWTPGREPAVREVAARPDALPTSALGGRRALRRLADPAGALLVREYGKGGLFRAVRGRAMHGPWRPLQELVLHRRLAALGVPVASAVGAVVLRQSFGWRGFLVLEELVGARDLEAILHGLPVPDGRERRRVYEAAGRAVRALHDAGVPHPDLHPKNILATADGRVVLLDLDKARPAEGPLGRAERLRNLLRLGRAIAKHRLKGLHLDVTDAVRFLEGYAGDREAALLWLDRIDTRLRRGLGLRRTWWRLLGEARPWRPPETEPAA